MKTLFLCALALLSVTTAVTTAQAEVDSFWTKGLFDNDSNKAPPDGAVLKKLVNLTSDRDLRETKPGGWHVQPHRQQRQHLFAPGH